MSRNVVGAVLDFFYPTPEECVKLTPQVKFTRIAREWKVKYSNTDNMASLNKVQEIFESLLPYHIKAELLGLISVHRVVDWTNSEFKVILTLSAKRFQEWENDRFDGPEQMFIKEATAVPGVISVEALTYSMTQY